MILNTGRSRDQWHTMTRTGTVAALGRHSPEPYVEISAADAGAYGVRDGGLAEVSTALGKTVLRVRINEDQRPGMMFAPIHWNDQYRIRGHHKQPDRRRRPTRFPGSPN